MGATDDHGEDHWLLRWWAIPFWPIYLAIAIPYAVVFIAYAAVDGTVRGYQHRRRMMKRLRAEQRIISVDEARRRLSEGRGTLLTLIGSKGYETCWWIDGKLDLPPLPPVEPIQHGGDPVDPDFDAYHRDLHHATSDAACELSLKKLLPFAGAAVLVDGDRASRHALRRDELAYPLWCGFEDLLATGDVEVATRIAACLTSSSPP